MYFDNFTNKKVNELNQTINLVNSLNKEEIKKYCSLNNFTLSQRNGFEILLSKSNCFVSGKAGTGKSYLLNKYMEFMSKHNIKILKCAPTGLAAVNIKGRTIHKCFKVSIYPTIINKKTSFSDTVVSEISKYDVIVIDEISMCRIDLFEHIVSIIDEANRRFSKKIKIVVSGDFFQLPPVVPDSEKTVLKEIFNTDTGFAFESDLWKLHKFKKIILKENVRQKILNTNSNSDEFIENLNYLRSYGSDKWINYFNKNTSTIKFNDNDAVNLFATNKEVNDYNSLCLNKLKGKTFTYKAIINNGGDFKSIPEDKYPFEEKIVLKVGARVMALRNDSDNLYQNGSLGTVYRCFDDYVVVKFDNGITCSVNYRKETMFKNPVFDKLNNKIVQEQYLSTFSQIPLKLSYALTVHKSQGQTFEKINFNPLNDKKERLNSGQLYVALSRVKSIKNIYLINPLKKDYLKIDNKVLDYYNEL